MITTKQAPAAGEKPARALRDAPSQEAVRKAIRQQTEGSVPLALGRYVTRRELDRRWKELAEHARNL